MPPRSHKKKPKTPTTVVVNPEQFSSLARETIQVLSTPQRHQLTGIHREVKDSCADWHNYMNRWKEINDEGTVIVKDICNTKLAAEGPLEDYQLSEMTDPTFDKLQGLCNLLDVKYQALLQLVNKMEEKTSKFKALMELSNFQNESSVLSDIDDGSNLTPPLFDVWTIDKYYCVSSELLEMFKKEIELKKCIVQSVALVTGRDNLFLLTASWSYTPHIDKSAQHCINSMLLETGFV